MFAVVASYDRFMNLDKLSKAVNYLCREQGPRVHFIATNEDVSFPLKPGEITLGAGIVSTALTRATGRLPLVMGKPCRPMWKYICQRSAGQGKKIEPGRTLMVGDR